MEDVARQGATNICPCWLQQPCVYQKELVPTAARKFDSCVKFLEIDRLSYVVVYRVHNKVIMLQMCSYDVLR